MSYKIDKGIAPPPPSANQGGYTYPWPDMEVGDSIVVPLPPDSTHTRNLAASMCASARRYCNVHAPGKKFTIRVLRGENVIRAWRLT